MQTIAVCVRPRFQIELGAVFAGGRRFADFVASNQDKIHKKLGATNEEERHYVRAELVVARAFLADRRFSIAIEAYVQGPGR